MPGFRTIGEFAQADDAGRAWITSFRKLVASAATPTSGLIDYLYYAGTPPANFYASAPGVSALVEAIRGIYIPSVTPSKQFLKSLLLMTNAASATTTSNQRQKLILADYLLYYPFIDTDAIGEEQVLENTIALPRYPYGKIICVSQSAASAVGAFTIKYTNQDGVPNRTSKITYTISTLTGGGQVATTDGSAVGFHPFVSLQAGDYGVRSIQSITFSAAGGGLMALVLVKPLLTHVVTQECRRTTTGNLESYGAANEFLSIVHQPGAVEFKDGAVIGLFGQGFAGSLASSALIGILETVWR